MEGSDGETSSLGSQHTNQQRSANRAEAASSLMPHLGNPALLSTLFGQIGHKSPRFKGRDMLPGEMPRNLGAKFRAYKEETEEVCPASCRIQWENLSDVITSVKEARGESVVPYDSLYVMCVHAQGSVVADSLELRVY